MQKKANNKKAIALWLAIALLLGLIGGGLGTALVLYSNENESMIPAVRNSDNDGNEVTLEAEESIAQVAQKVAPSTVSITTEAAGGRMLRQGAGTGIIVSNDGYIITNKHVVNGARSASVSLTDGNIYDDVQIVGVDPLNDIAFLKINGVSDLTPAEIGESSTLRIGQTMVAIGNSLGEFQNTVTSGIVSGLGRPISAQSEDGTGVESLNDLIQTDAAINPGNSGGPLVNLAGQVVGINTAVATDAQGIGFAIPINAVKGMLEGVLETGKVERAYLGVRYVDITPAIVKEEKLSVKQGAYVAAGRGGASAIEAGGPADEAGIEDGDIITRIGDLTIGEHGGMSSLIGEYRPGSEVEIAVLRNGNEQTMTVKLAAYVPEEAAAEAPALNERESRAPTLRDLFGF